MRDLEGYNSALEQLISNVAEENREAVATIVDGLRDDYSEAIGELSHYGDITDGKYTPSRNEEAEKWKEKYNAEVERYKKRWSTGADPDGGNDPDDPEPVTIADILKEVD